MNGLIRDGITTNELRRLISYNKTTGIFTRRITTSRRAKAGAVVGKPCKGRYLEFRINRITYKSHRLAWLYVYGRWPKGEIDHINGDCHDNRISNLRDVPHQWNQQNFRKAMRHSVSGILGVSRENRKFRARIFVNGKEVRLGLFRSKKEAHLAYVEGKRRLHKGCTI